MKIYTVRHGQTEWNKKGLYQGKTDVPLNEEGKKQAMIVKEKLKDKNILESEKDLLLHTIEDTNYQINTQQEIINLIQSLKVKNICIY